MSSNGEIFRGVHAFGVIYSATVRGANGEFAILAELDWPDMRKRIRTREQHLIERIEHDLQQVLDARERGDPLGSLPLP